MNIGSWLGRGQLEEWQESMLEQIRLGQGQRLRGNGREKKRARGMRQKQINLENYGYESRVNPQMMLVEELALKVELQPEMLAEYENATCDPLYEKSLLSAVNTLAGQTALLRVAQYAPWRTQRRESIPRELLNTDHPGYSLIIIGGGQSEAMGNVDFIARVCDAWQELVGGREIKHLSPPSTRSGQAVVREEQARKAGRHSNHGSSLSEMQRSEVKSKGPDVRPGLRQAQARKQIQTLSKIPPINNIVILSHAAGSPSTIKYQSLTQEALVLDQALQNEHISLPGRKIVMGFSAGGGVGLELAALMDAMDRGVDQLILMDPAGLAKHPRLQWEFSVREAQSAYLDEKRDKQASLVEASSRAFENMKSALTSPDGVMDLKEMVKYLMGRSDWMLELIEMHDMEGKVKKTGIRSHLLKKDSTWAARQQVGHNYPTKVILSPIMLARVVNLALDRLDIPYSALEAAMNDADKQMEIGMQLEAEIQSMFPHVPNQDIRLVPNWRYYSHSSGIMDQENWLAILREVVRHDAVKRDLGARVKQAKDVVWPWGGR